MKEQIVMTYYNPALLETNIEGMLSRGCKVVSMVNIPINIYNINSKYEFDIQSHTIVIYEREVEK